MKDQFFSSSLRRCIKQGLLKLRFLLLLSVLALPALNPNFSSRVFADFPKAVSVQEIIGGVESSQNAQSWMVALINKASSETTPSSRRQFCGGVLISDEWILTAAHCVLRSSVSNTSAIIGQNNIDNPAGEPLSIAQIVIHPDYNSRTFENDVALLRLALPVQQEPIVIADSSPVAELNGQTATVFGWGQTYISPDRCNAEFSEAQPNPEDFTCRVHDFERDSRDFQSTLLQADITILSDADCNARILDLLAFLEIDQSGLGGDSDFTPLNQICAFDPVETDGVCFGDSGGPITIMQDNRPVLLGTSSLIYGAGGCERRFATDVFTLTRPFSDFMNEVMHRDYALSFDNFCPPVVVPVIEYEAPDEAGVVTRIRWDTVRGVKNYILRYLPLTATIEDISTVVIDGALSEVSAQLEPGASFYVSIQAENDFCTGPSSEVLTLQVPGS